MGGQGSVAGKEEGKGEREKELFPPKIKFHTLVFPLHRSEPGPVPRVGSGRSGGCGGNRTRPGPRPAPRLHSPERRGPGVLGVPAVPGVPALGRPHGRARCRRSPVPACPSSAGGREGGRKGGGSAGLGGALGARKAPLASVRGVPGPLSAGQNRGSRQNPGRCGGWHGAGECSGDSGNKRSTESLRLEKTSESSGSNINPALPRLPLSPGVIRTRLLNPSENGDFTTAPSSLCQSWKTLSVKKFSLLLWQDD